MSGSITPPTSFLDLPPLPDNLRAVAKTVAAVRTPGSADRGFVADLEPGPIGPAGPQGPGFTYRGSVANSTDYAPYDVVTYGGQVYVTLVAFTSAIGFDPSEWTLMIPRAIGATGPAGPVGDSGPAGPAGVQGIQGIQGAAGVTGPQGSIGNTGPKGDVGPGFNFRGAWATGTQYNPYDVVRNDGQLYVSLTSFLSASTFAANNWQLMIPAAPAGATGPTGAQGIQGVQGLKGDTGSQGLTGLVGPKGDTGPQGASGSAGNQGIAGPQGLKGDVGATGPQGAKGDPGNVGATGVAGPAGASGATGPAGVKGDAGATGLQGPKGDTGSIGPAGAQGSAGPTGSTGAAGPAGPTGSTGLAGSAGPAGATGAKGDTGATGSAGVQGPKGDTGSAGATGLQGIQGLKGDKGDTGSQGPAGATGSTGASGAPGSPGPTGAQGPTGSAGPIGQTGPQGVQGVQGPSGTGTGTVNPGSAGQIALYVGSGTTLSPGTLGAGLSLTGTTLSSTGVGASGFYYNAKTDGTAKGDGTTDDTAALNAGYAAAHAAGRAFFIPPGHYKVTGTLHFGGSFGGQVFIEALPGQTYIESNVASRNIVASISGYVLTVTSAPGGQLGVGCIVTVPGGIRCSIRSQLTSTASNVMGLTGTYQLDVSQNIASATMAVGFPIVLVGNGFGANGFNGGRVSGLIITGPSAAPSYGSIALCVAAMTDVVIDECEVANTTIGFDAVENSFGTNWNNSYAGAGGSCQCGTNIRGGPTGGAGNQVKTNNLWSTGTIAGISVSPESDGITVSVGQMGCTNSDQSDNVGPILWGKDFVTGLMGGLGELSILQVDIEQFDGWALRGFGNVNIDVQSCPIISRSVSGGGQKSRGVLKCDNAANMRLTMEKLNPIGDFSELKPIVINGYGGGSYYERASIVENVTFAGAVQAPSQSQSLFEISQLIPGIAFFHDYISGKDCVYANGVRTILGLTSVTGVIIDGTTIVASTTSPYQMMNADSVVDVNKTTGAPSKIYLPINPPLWAKYTIADGKGDAATNNITISAPNGFNYVIVANTAAVTFCSPSQGVWIPA